MARVTAIAVSAAATVGPGPSPITVIIPIARIATADATTAARAARERLRPGWWMSGHRADVEIEASAQVREHGRIALRVAAERDLDERGRDRPLDLAFAGEILVDVVEQALAHH